MDRNSLYVLILVLGAAIGIAYVGKTKGGIDKIFSPAESKQHDGWLKDDPGWDTMPRPQIEQTPPPIVPPPPAPKMEPKQPEPKAQPQPRMQPLNRPPLNCPPNG